MRQRFMMWMKIVGVASLLLAGCGQSEPSQSQNIFGPDNRELPANTAPYTAIGRLDNGCTGTLIGKRLVLTAAHCVYDSTSGTIKPDVKFFQPNLRAGRSTNPAWIEFAWLGTDKPEDNRASDWALLRVDRDLSAFGKVAVHELDFAAVPLPYTVSLIGYSVDRDSGNDASLHRGCYVHKFADQKLSHDCDAAAGSSGGPLLQVINGNSYIVGMTVSEYRQGASGSVTRDQYSQDYSNVAVPAAAFAPTATQILKSLDDGVAVPALEGIIEVVNPNNRDPGNSNPSNPADPSRPPEPSYSVVEPRLLMWREGLINQTMGAMGNTVSYIASIGEGTNAYDLKASGDKMVAATRTFNQAMVNFVRSSGAGTTYGQVVYAHRTMMAAAQQIKNYDPANLPTHAVGELQRARVDLQNQSERLNALVLN